MREKIARQLAPYLPPGITRFALLTRKGRVIGLYPDHESALALINKQRTVYRVVTELWYRGKTRIHLSYQLVVNPA